MMVLLIFIISLMGLFVYSKSAIISKVVLPTTDIIEPEIYRRGYIMLERMFHLTDNQTDVKTEVMAGLTTFFAMSYILFVAPDILANTACLQEV